MAQQTPPPVEGEKVEIPQPVTRNEQPEGGTSGGWKALLPPVIASAVITFLMIQALVVPRIDDASKFGQSALTEVTATKASLATEVSKISSLQAQIAQSTTTANNLNQEISAIKAREAQFLTSDKLTALQAQVTQVVNTVNGLGSQSGEISQLKTQLAALTKTVTDIQASINATSGTGTGGTTVVSGQVVPTIIGNPFTGVQYLKYDTSVNGTTATQTLSFQIANGTGKTINNLQLGVLLQILDVNGANYYTLPAGTSLSVMAGSNMMGSIWTEQSTGVSYYRGFTNSAMTGILGGIGALSQPPGIQTYSVTVSIANQTGTTLPAIVIYPVVKVLSYN